MPPSLVRLGHHEYPSKPSDCDVKIFIGEESVTHTYMEICEFSYAGSDELPDRSAISTAELCKSQACEAGCDAILIKAADAEGFDLNPSGFKQEKMAIIKGIKFVDPPANSGNMDPNDLLYLHVK